MKLQFALLGYKNIQFYCLPEDMSSGSRELLIAFSWLLQTDKLLDNMLKRKLQNSDISKDFDLDIFNNQPQEQIPKLSSIEEYYNYILWISGRINNNLKQISEYKLRTLQFTNKVIIYFEFFYYFLIDFYLGS